MPSPFVNLIRDFATQTTLALVKTAVDAINAKIPAAPATEGKQDTGNASLSSIDGKLPSALVSDRIKVDGSGVTQPVSDAGGSLTVDGGVTAAQGTAAAANAPWYVRLSDGAAAVSVALDATVQAVRDRLPSSLGQLARASSLGVTLSTEDAAKVPSLGQALAAGCVPVVLPAAQAGGALALDATVSAMSAKLPAALGLTTPALSLSVVPAIMRSTGVVASVPTTGVQVKATPGTAYQVYWTNSTGGTVYIQWYDSNTAPSPGDSPVAYSGPIASANVGGGGQGHITEGVPCPNVGLFMILSSTQATYTAIVSTNFKYVAYYR